MQRVHLAQVFSKRRDQAVGQDGHAVLPTVASRMAIMSWSKSIALDAQTDALHQAQAAAVEQAGHQLVHTGH